MIKFKQKIDSHESIKKKLKGFRSESKAELKRKLAENREESARKMEEAYEEKIQRLNQIIREGYGKDSSNLGHYNSVLFI